MSVLSYDRLGRSNNAASILGHPRPHPSSKPAGSAAKKLFSSKITSVSGHDRSAGATKSAANVYFEAPHSNGSLARDVKSAMTSYGTAIGSIPNAKKSHAKLHKRGGSGSSTSLPGPPSVLRGSSETFTTPFATYEEPHQHQRYSDASNTPSQVPTPRLKPYLRKMSKDNAKEDQGKLDLSKATAENERLAGLGIQEVDPRIASDVSFAHSRRRTTSHSRTISGGSQISNGSGSSSFKPTQPFVHPMRQTPRPYTPPIGHSSASSVNNDEADESSDVVDDEFKLGHGFRSRRSMSIGSTPQIPPTPLSQSYTASDLGLVPKLSCISQSNFSTDSLKSEKPPKSRYEYTRRDTDTELPTSPSSRTSFDRAFSLVNRKSELEPEDRDERIRIARRKFEEKEAQKSRKAEKETSKRREAERNRSVQQEELKARKSESHDRSKLAKRSETKDSKRRKDSKVTSHDTNEKFDARPYEGYRESNEASLPVQGRTAGSSEKVPTMEFRAKPAKGAWIKFETWTRTRVLGCGPQKK